MTRADKDKVASEVYKPEGHTVISFPSAEQAEAARAALGARLGLAGDQVRHYTDREMLSQLAHEMEPARPLATIGQEMNLALAHKALAERGYHWLVVRTADDDLARRVADCVKPLGAERAQRYGRFIIEELIEHRGDTRQVAESPDRGADAATPSGEEKERAELRPAPPPPAHRLPR